MSSSNTPRGPLQPHALKLYNEPTTRLKDWMIKLPDSAFGMTGKLQDIPTSPLQPDDRRRILYSECADAGVSVEEKLIGWSSVSYQLARPSCWGLEGFEGVIVAYHMPAKGSAGNETFYVGVPTEDWLTGKLGPEKSKNSILVRLTPLGWPSLMPILRRKIFSPSESKKPSRPLPSKRMGFFARNFFFKRAKRSSSSLFGIKVRNSLRMKAVQFAVRFRSDFGGNMTSPASRVVLNFRIARLITCLKVNATLKFILPVVVPPGKPPIAGGGNEGRIEKAGREVVLRDWGTACPKEAESPGHRLASGGPHLVIGTVHC
ncbi:hypothetical protein M407DRAFT_6834 [Tulasnella calospora MUT 4182]|uniref:Uncharacterized protein n=1 Tax=Tulasnella calospora MUT 4182 TaxID=1051891 RepID=A0A0C3M3N0_9AGAM|nr:hypothetical protein M407DRAFT_6834 [Tulasnella calospora MUT 4182]